MIRPPLSSDGTTDHDVADTVAVEHPTKAGCQGTPYVGCRKPRSLGQERTAGGPSPAGLVVELTHGGVVGLADREVEAGAERFERLLVVIMGGEPGEQVEPCGGDDLLEALQASLAVFDVAESCVKPGALSSLDDQRRSQGRHPGPGPDVELVVFDLVLR